MGGKIKSKTCPDNPNISLCGELFYGLEKYLAGNPGTYKYWEKVAENLEVDRLAYTTAQEIISALRETKQKYGIEVAQTLYNTHSVHYPREIVNAGRYSAPRSQTQCQQFWKVLPAECGGQRSQI